MEGKDNLDILTCLLEESDSQIDGVETFGQSDEEEDVNKDQHAESRENSSGLLADINSMEDQGKEMTKTLDQTASDRQSKSKEELEAELRCVQQQMWKLKQQLKASECAKTATMLPQDQCSTVEAPIHEQPSKFNRQTQQCVSSKFSRSAGKASTLLTSPLSISTGEVSLPVVPKATPCPPSLGDVAVEKFSGLRLRKPLVTSTEMECKMANRRLIRLSQLPSRLKREKLEDSDWVTFAVIVSKVTTQSNSSGKPFSIWKLNDLRDLEVYISLFLFGEVHKELWKTAPGTVIGLLNPNPLKPKEGSNEVCLSVDHPQKILIMGIAQDFGTCKAVKNNGDPCNQLVNLNECQVCQYHMKAQYKSLSSKRMELQSSFSGKMPEKARRRMAAGLKERLCQSGFHYGGVSSMAFAASRICFCFLAAMRSNNISGCSDDFKSLMSMPTPGALNLKKHLQQGKSSGLAGITGTGIQSISAAQLIKQQKQQLLESRRRKAEEAQQRFLQTVPSPLPQTTKVAELTSKAQYLTPKLGRGFNDCEDILFFDHTSTPPAISLSAAKVAALKKLQAKGVVISKEDPNAIKRKRPSISDVAGRVEKNLASNQSGSEEDSSEPEQKKCRKYLEYLQSDAFQQILNAKSKHLESLQAAEVQIQKEYFDPLVKKEQIEEKMRNIREMKCRAVTCKTCNYTYFKPLDRCVQDKHEYNWHDAVKRFFKCPCGQRSISLDRLPHKHCSNCGLFKWERDGMIKEKSGPKIGGELLLPRGEEQSKFLNSMK
ncbi:hypothetical protein GN956_G429 [Arapaima gigas]